MATNRRKIVSKSDKELKQIALDLHSNKIFCDRHLKQITKHDPHFIKMVFMPLVFMDGKELEKLRKRRVDFIYEYYDKAAPRNINGYPCFFSMRCLTENETERMFGFYNKIKDSVDEALREIKP